MGRNSWHQHPVLRVANNLITLLFAGVIALTAIFYYVRSQFDQEGPLDYATVVVIPKGEGVRAIAERLERDGVIMDQRIFVASVMYFRATEKLKAGEYAIKKRASIREVLDTLVEGKAILYSVSIPEGLTSYQVVERLNAQIELTGRLTLVPPEGSLLPDTYRYARGTTREDIIARMRREQEKFIEKIWGTRTSSLPIKTKQDAITLASIIEKETGQADERPKVAAVFLNRLKKGMRLESDPTIIYGLSGGKGTLGRSITKADMEQMTPYNTYRNGGLTPTAIANPGRAALEAVLRPAKTSDLFFVANGTGGHTFAETFEDHKKNVGQWRQVEQKMREAAEAKAEAAAKAEGAAKADAAKAESGKVQPGKADTAKTESGKQPAATTQATVRSVTATVPGVAVTSTANGGAESDDGKGGVPLPARKPKP